MSDLTDFILGHLFPPDGNVEINDTTLDKRKMGENPKDILQDEREL
ncbi:hypothetical protein ACFLUY_02675 [Chloroflexota bacterium]